MKGVMRREKRRGRVGRREGLIERMRGVGAERGDGRRVGVIMSFWAEILTQMMSFSLYHGNLRNAFSNQVLKEGRSVTHSPQSTRKP